MGSSGNPTLSFPSPRSPNPLALFASSSSSALSSSSYSPIAEHGGARGDGSRSPPWWDSRWEREGVRLVDLCSSLRGSDRVEVFDSLAPRAIRVRACRLALGGERCRLRVSLPPSRRGKGIPINSSSREGIRMKFLVSLAMPRSRKSRVRTGEWLSSKNPEFNLGDFKDAVSAFLLPLHRCDE